jgi:hypothetical protein
MIEWSRNALHVNFTWLWPQSSLPRQFSVWPPLNVPPKPPSISLLRHELTQIPRGTSCNHVGANTSVTNEISRIPGTCRCVLLRLMIQGTVEGRFYDGVPGCVRAQCRPFNRYPYGFCGCLDTIIKPIAAVPQLALAWECSNFHCDTTNNLGNPTCSPYVESKLRKNETPHGPYILNYYTVSNEHTPEVHRKRKVASFEG